MTCVGSVRHLVPWSGANTLFLVVRIVAFSVLITTLELMFSRLLASLKNFVFPSNKDDCGQGDDTGDVFLDIVDQMMGFVPLWIGHWKSADRRP